MVTVRYRDGTRIDVPDRNRFPATNKLIQDAQATAESLMTRSIGLESKALAEMAGDDIDLGPCFADTEPANCDGPSPLSHYIHVGDHVFDIRDIEHVYIPERSIRLRGRLNPFSLKTDAEMQLLLSFTELAGMHRAAATP